MARQILFTGTTGTIGKPLLRELIDNHPGLHIRIANDVEPEHGPNVEWVPTDFRNSGIDYDALVKDCDFVIHLAAETTPLHRNFDEVNHIATRELALAAERSGTVQHFLYTSTCLAYGFPSTRRVPDGQMLTEPPFMPPREPMKAYAVSKYLSEKAIETVADRVSYVILRPVHVLSEATIKGALSGLVGLRRWWWGHRPWHPIPTASAVKVLTGFLNRSLWADLPRISYYNFSADDPEYYTYDALRGGPQRGIRRAFDLKVLPWVDLAKDMVKLRHSRRAWNYTSVLYDGSRLRSLGLRLSNYRGGGE